MARRAYIEQQRREHGRKAVAVLPVHYPRALLTAMNVLAVELWGPPGEPRGPEAGRIQPYVCAVVRNALAFMAGGHADCVDAVLFPHTCDSIQGLATLAPDMGGWQRPALRFIHPKGDVGPAQRGLIRSELERLAEGLESLTGAALDANALTEAIELHDRIDAARRALLERRPYLEMDDTALYRLLRRGEWLWPAEHLAELETALGQMREEPMQIVVPLMVTGYVPEPGGLLSALSEAGARIVADDYAAIGRRVPRVELIGGDDAMAALVERQVAVVPCPTRGGALGTRLDYLQALAEQSEAAGLLIHVVKFCEPELFDVPAIKQRFDALGIPVLVLETALEAELSGQAMTRLEAFVELVAESRRAA